MKHKRQTLTKEDGDDKDGGGSSDGLEKSLKSETDDEKKSCHNCDISGVGDVGSTLAGDVTDLNASSVRGANSGSNNNTPSATNNNNNSAGFNANSNGASSVGSTNSVSSTFDKMMVDEDSRSHDGSDVTSPSLSSKKLDTRVKLETGHKSPNPTKQISISKKSPSTSAKEMCAVSSNGVLLALPDSTVGTPTLPNQQGSSTRSLTPSSTPSTPASVQLQGSPLNVQQATHGVYMQRPRSSPSSSNPPGNVPANLLHTSNPTGAISPHNRNISAAQNHFQQGVYHQTSPNIDYRNGVQGRQPMSAQQGGGYCSREAAYHQQQQQQQQQQMISYGSGGEMHPQYARGQGQSMGRVNHHARASAARSMYNHHSMQQFHQQHNQYASTGDYNGYAQTGSYHAAYHARWVRDIII